MPKQRNGGPGVRRLRRGISLIEVLVALSVISISFVFITQGYASGFTLQEKSRRLTIASAVAESTVEWFRSLPYDQIDSATDPGKLCPITLPEGYSAFLDLPGRWLHLASRASRSRQLNEPQPTPTQTLNAPIKPDSFVTPTPTPSPTPPPSTGSGSGQSGSGSPSVVQVGSSRRFDVFAVRAPSYSAGKAPVSSGGRSRSVAPPLPGGGSDRSPGIGDVYSPVQFTRTVGIVTQEIRKGTETVGELKTITVVVTWKIKNIPQQVVMSTIRRKPQ